MIHILQESCSPSMEFTCAREQRSNLLQSLTPSLVTKLYKETLHSDDTTEAGLPQQLTPSLILHVLYNKKLFYF